MIYRVTSAAGQRAIVLCPSYDHAVGILPWHIIDVEKIGVVTGDVQSNWRHAAVLMVEVP